MFFSILTIAGGGTVSGQGMLHTVLWQQDPSTLNSVLVLSPLIICAHSAFVAGSLKHWPSTAMACERTPAMVVAIKCIVYEFDACEGSEICCGKNETWFVRVRLNSKRRRGQRHQIVFSWFKASIHIRASSRPLWVFPFSDPYPITLQQQASCGELIQVTWND